MKYDNPAARLHSLLAEGKNKPGHVNCQQTWHELLNTEGNDSALMSRLGEVAPQF